MLGKFDEEVLDSLGDEAAVVKSAKDAIEGLALTAFNYKEAIVILKNWFGNPQLIISKHMEELMNTDSVSSVLFITALKCMYDTVEVHVRGLKSLRVALVSYGALLMPVLQKKLPPELKIVLNREITKSSDLDKLMTTLADEIEVRESPDAADIAQHYSSGPPEVLIGSDQYWQLVSGKVMRGSDGPVAKHTKRLRQDPELLRECNVIIEGQLKSGIIELVDNADSISNERTHYLPHHAVVRRDKATTNVRVVYDASAKAEGSSL
uniref:Uncharacterized protein n=1 Tax=Amphimedon queenslandica TaxID=400682 RepID=A0A1X7V1C4_AMPQE